MIFYHSNIIVNTIVYNNILSYLLYKYTILFGHRIIFIVFTQQGVEVDCPCVILKADVVYWDWSTYSFHIIIIVVLWTIYSIIIYAIYVYGFALLDKNFELHHIQIQIRILFFSLFNEITYNYRCYFMK